MSRDRHRLRDWAPWQLAGFVALGTLPAVWSYGQAVWEVGVDERRTVLVLAGVFLAGVLVFTVPWLRGRLRPVGALGAGAFLLAVGYLGLLLRDDLPFEVPGLLGGSALVLGLLLIPSLAAAAPPSRRRAILGTGWGALLAVAGATAASTLWAPPAAPTEARVLVTNGSSVRVTAYPPIEGESGDGGGITRLADGFLIGTGAGRFERLRSSGDDASLAFELLDLPPPPRGPEGSAGPPEIGFDRFRLGDVERVESPRGPLVLATQPFWDEGGECIRVRVHELPEAALDAAEDARWGTLYASRPCAPLERRGGTPAFAGHMTGGRIAQLDGERILLTVGNFPGDWLAQDTTSDYGKTLVIDLATGEATRFSLGHRNAQGLAVLADGRIALTEHGPRGGDELNVLVPGGNYGWPAETYGLEYEASVRPEFPDLERPPETVPPAFAWVPSIGVSNVIEVRGDAFPRWTGDLLIGSLRDESLFRVRWDGERVAYAERIPIGERVRDLVEAEDGRVLVWTDAHRVLVLSPPADGGFAALQPCLACHPLDRTHAIGPGLEGVYGRRIASAPGFDYSPALSSEEGRWTAERLTEYLADPAAAIPGTTMEADGITDSLTLARVVALLRGLGDGESAEAGVPGGEPR